MPKGGLICSISIIEYFHLSILEVPRQIPTWDSLMLLPNQLTLMITELIGNSSKILDKSTAKLMVEKGESSPVLLILFS
jgi:hypothetical protein